MNAIDTFLPATAKAGRNPSEPHPVRPPEPAENAARADTSSFGQQLSQTSQTQKNTQQNPESEKTSPEPAALTTKQDAGTASTTPGSAAQATTQTPQTSQTAENAALKIEGQSGGVHSTAQQTAISDSDGSSQLQLLPAAGSESGEAGTAQPGGPRAAMSPVAPQPQIQQTDNDSGAGQNGVATPSQATSAPQESNAGAPQIAADNTATPVEDIATGSGAAIAGTQMSDDSTLPATEPAAPQQGPAATANNPTTDKPASDNPATMADKMAQASLPSAAEIDATVDNPTAPDARAATAPKADAMQPTGTVPGVNSGQNGQAGTAPGFAEAQIIQSENRLKADTGGNQTATPLPAAGNRAGATPSGAAGAAQSVAATDPAIPPSGTGANSMQALSANTATPDVAARLAATGGETSPSDSEIKSETAALRPNNLPSGETGSGLMQTADAGRTAAEAPPRAAPPPPPPSPPVRDISMQIARHVEAGANQFQMRLDPPELGRVDIRMQIAQDGKLTLIVAAERPETVDLLQRDARVLERSLHDAGLKTDSQSLNFSLKDSGKSFSGWRDDGDNDPAADSADDGWEIQAENSTTRRRFTDRAVNIQI